VRIAGIVLSLCGQPREVKLWSLLKSPTPLPTWDATHRHWRSTMAEALCQRGVHGVRTTSTSRRFARRRVQGRAPRWLTRRRRASPGSRRGAHPLAGRACWPALRIPGAGARSNSPRRWKGRGRACLCALTRPHRSRVEGPARLLTAIHRALDLIAAKRDEAFFTVLDVPAEDPATYAMMCRADTVGVFQIEGRAHDDAAEISGGRGREASVDEITIGIMAYRQWPRFRSWCRPCFSPVMSSAQAYCQGRTRCKRD
jgi:hypothetical protein